jgi:hypothetical protein
MLQVQDELLHVHARAVVGQLVQQLLRARHALVEARCVAAQALRRQGRGA